MAVETLVGLQISAIMGYARTGPTPGSFPQNGATLAQGEDQFLHQIIDHSQRLGWRCELDVVHVLSNSGKRCSIIGQCSDSFKAMTSCALSKSVNEHGCGYRVTPAGRIAFSWSASKAKRDIGPILSGEPCSATPLENARQAKPSVLAR